MPARFAGFLVYNGVCLPREWEKQRCRTYLFQLSILCFSNTSRIGIESQVLILKFQKKKKTSIFSRTVKKKWFFSKEDVPKKSRWIKWVCSRLNGTFSFKVRRNQARHLYGWFWMRPHDIYQRNLHQKKWWMLSRNMGILIGYCSRRKEWEHGKLISFMDRIPGIDHGITVRFTNPSQSQVSWFQYTQ